MADFAGNISLAIQILALIILFVGIVPSKLAKQKRNLILHGFLSIVSLVLNAATILAVMFPTVFSDLSGMPQFTALNLAIIWAHIISGAVAFGLGLFMVIVWISKPIGQLRCYKTRMLMAPTIIVWVLSVVLGAYLHLAAIT